MSESGAVAWFLLKIQQLSTIQFYKNINDCDSGLCVFFGVSCGVIGTRPYGRRLPQVAILEATGLVA